MENNLGPIVATYKDSILGRRKFLLFINIIVLILGLFSIYIYSISGSGEISLGNGVTFDTGSSENNSILLYVGLFMVFLGILFNFLLYRTVCKRNFILHEHGISTKIKNRPETQLDFKNVHTVYLFGSQTVTNNTINCLAYKKDPEDSWLVITPSIHKYKTLIESFREKHTHANLAKLQSLDTVEFKYICNTNTLARKMFSLGFKYDNNNEKGLFDAQVLNLSLSKGEIIIDNDTAIPLEVGDKISINKHSEIILVDSENRQKLSLNLSAVINGDLFFHLCQSHLSAK
ncbi:hypothetical protein [Listeria seeligeri]|uniref:hypothetical protein n=1 Tax=Listeria seeligeri TaxID=1640 RepID=UPI0022EBCF61|nr:hypothetical protein [Listeria seeligeri]